MPAIPIIYWLGAGAFAALGIGGHQLGKEVGEKVGQTAPIAAVIIGGMVAYKMASKK